MALIICPECGKEISDTARSCPNCGYPITAKENEENLTTSAAVGEIPKKKFSSKAIAIGCLIIAIIIGVVCFLSKGQDTIVGTWEDSSTLDGFVFIYQFSEDGKFSSSIQQGDVTVPGGTGRYELDGNTMKLTMSNGQSMSDEFSVKGDTLKWGSQTLTRRK